MKAQIAAHESGAPKDATGVEGNDPKPVKEHVPEAPPAHPALIKRTYKPSADSSQPGPSSAPDFYTTKILGKSPTRQNSPSGSTPEQACKMAWQKMADKRKQEDLGGPSKTKSHKPQTTIKMKRKKKNLNNCTDMPESEILATFADYRQELHEIFLKHKDELEEQWMANKELVDYTDVAHLFNEDQKMAMMQVLENEFVPIELNGKVMVLL
ncbi:AGAP013399-PA [Anopheles gambiae str. PEST]|uniref:AGAP013399-PA n=1 Tax=Anopheles gambiae TaxID=7165 RepID=F5HJQ1_ANOGA|nr:AGAP013399-PA [Anopheles gambiae str. PEST]